jgi:hypothetical protein
MYLDDFGHKGSDAPTGGGVRANGGREAAPSALGREDPLAAAPVGRPAANLLSNTCARLAERIRESAGVTSEQSAAPGTPWLGLLLWFFACAALFVSLTMRPAELERDHRVAARTPAQPPIAAPPYLVPALSDQASKVRLIVSPRPSPHWAAH